MRNLAILITAAVALAMAGCNSTAQNNGASDPLIKPAVVTEKVKYDSDDPAIWINPVDHSKSLIVGTDKNDDGALYVFDLNGKIIADKVVHNLKRPNNVDIEYGLMLKGRATDIAVVTERHTHKLRIFSLPDMTPVDGGGIDVFNGETGNEYRDLMGISLYKNTEGKIYAIVGRKTGPTDGTYLWQYLLEDNGNGTIKATLARKFGKYSGKKEIEAIAVDDALGYVYYSDEGFGVRKYYADPAKGNQELAVFGKTDFTQDHEGISIYQSGDSTGYILVSDQQSNHFNVYPREGDKGNPNQHTLVRKLHLSTMESDGSDVISVPLNPVFQKGLFVAMSTDGTFQYYKWEDLWK